jgi:hypothetical protein
VSTLITGAGSCSCTDCELSCQAPNFESSITKEPIFYANGIDWWLVGTVIAFAFIAIVYLMAVWIDYYFCRKKFKEVEDTSEEDEIKIKKCWPRKSPGLFFDDALAKFFQM